MNATLQAKVDRLKEIEEATAGLSEEDVRIQAPGLWKEKTQLLAAIRQTTAETQALEASRQADEETRQRTAEFPAKSAKYCADAFAAGRPLEEAVSALLNAHAAVIQFADAHSALAHEARALGLAFPTFAATLGISASQLERFHYACGLLRMTDV